MLTERYTEHELDGRYLVAWWRYRDQIRRILYKFMHHDTCGTYRVEAAGRKGEITLCIVETAWVGYLGANFQLWQPVMQWADAGEVVHRQALLSLFVVISHLASHMELMDETLSPFGVSLDIPNGEVAVRALA